MVPSGASTGQVFFVHNRVHDIEETAAGLKQLVPDARIAISPTLTASPTVKAEISTSISVGIRSGGALTVSENIF